MIWFPRRKHLQTCVISFLATNEQNKHTHSFNTVQHGRMNYKDTKPYMSAFLSVDLLTDIAAFCVTDFIDWRYIHSWFVFFTQLVNCCPHGRRNYTLLVYCCPSTVPSLCTVYTDSVWLWGGGVGGVKMYCGPYSAGVLHSVSDQIQNLQNCLTTPYKNDQ